MKNIFSFAILSFCLAGSQAALAEANGGGACKADRETLCAGMTPGEGLHKCMKENEDKLSAECKAQRTERKEQIGEIKEACAEDFSKFCKDIKPGRGRKIRCLKEHESELSEACKAELPKRQRRS
jgi:hypothetical protein